MSPSAPSILPDVQALRAVFDADFQSLVGQARGYLGDAASLAPRVAEGALVRAWDARSRLQTSEQLKTFLADDVKAAAGRTLARRAASQRAASGRPVAADQPSTGQVDMAQSWAYIVDATHVDPHTANEQKLIAEAARHETAEATTRATTGGISTKVAVLAGLAIVIVAVVAEMAVSRVSTEGVIAEAIAQPHGKVTNAPFGQTANITLNDGTKVRLAPDSKLFVPQNFGGKIRVVKLDGAGSFDVAPGSGTFRVYLRNAVVLAKSSSFAVSGYYTDSTAIVKAGTDGAEVRIGSNSTTLTAGQALVIDSADATRSPSPDEVDQATGWVDGKLSVTNRPLRDVLPLLQRWYTMDVNVQDSKLLDRPVTVHAPIDSSAPAISAIEKSGNLKFVQTGKTMIFQDAAPASGKTPVKK